MKITEKQLKQIIKEELDMLLGEGRTGSFFGYTGAGDVSIRSDEIRDAFEHRGIKVPFSLEDAELDSNKLRAMGFEYAPHDPRLARFLRLNPSNPYAWTLGFWYDPQDDWREVTIEKGGRLSEEDVDENLRDWFGKSKSKDGKKGWVQVVSGKPCARQPGQKTTPKCVSSAKRASMSKKERESAQRRKRAADPGQPKKTGAAKPTYVSTDKKKKKEKKKS